MSTKANQKTEEAVSPVIATILMVAISVILAAIVAAFIFGMANQMPTGKTVAVTALKDGGDIRLTNYGGADVGNLAGPIDITVTNATATTLGTAVGSSVTLTPAPSGYRVRVMALGTFKDGSTTILLDVYI